MAITASPTANETTCVLEFTVVHAFSIAYFITVIALGTVGNGLLLCVFIFNRALCKKSINFLICANTAVNFVISVLFDPIIAATNFVPCLRSHLRALFMVRFSSKFLLEVCVVSSIYTLTAVAANQYLLISRPNTTYRRCCTGRKAVSFVLTVIWLLALIVVVLFWLVKQSLIGGHHEKPQVDHSAIEIIFVLPCILNYCPLIVIPCFQWGTVRTIRASRKRVENKMAPSAAAVPTVASSVSSPSEARGLSLDGGPTTSVPLEPPMITDKNDGEEEKKVRRRGKAELRTLRTMMVMYMILVVSWTPSLIAWVSVSEGSEKVFDLFGAFLSVYPVLIPFALMWTNKNYSNVLRKKIWSKIQPQ